MLIELLKLKWKMQQGEEGTQLVSEVMGSMEYENYNLMYYWYCVIGYHKTCRLLTPTMQTCFMKIDTYYYAIHTNMLQEVWYTIY